MTPKIWLRKNIQQNTYSFAVQICDKKSISCSKWEIDYSTCKELETALERIWEQQDKKWWKVW